VTAAISLSCLPLESSGRVVKMGELVIVIAVEMTGSANRFDVAAGAAILM
jgi:hypothetical protein